MLRLLPALDRRFSFAGYFVVLLGS